MAIIAENTRHPFETAALRGMFETRKRVFVDLLKWDVPVIDGRYEIDGFDDEHAAYLIVAGPGEAHLGSARLLKTTRPHILDTLFPELCAGPVPSGSDIFEITRFCLSPDQRADERLETRNLLVSALVSHALAAGITTYTGVAEMGWLQQILAFGWRCRPLGLPRRIGGRMLGALRIDISPETPALLTSSGIYRPAPLAPTKILETA